MAIGTRVASAAWAHHPYWRHSGLNQASVRGARYAVKCSGLPENRMEEAGHRPTSGSIGAAPAASITAAHSSQLPVDERPDVSRPRLALLLSSRLTVKRSAPSGRGRSG